MSYHAVLAFPDDGEATLEVVLRQTQTKEIISSPMEDLLLICSSEADAVFIRCGLALLPATERTLLVPVSSRGTVAAWLMQYGMASRCEWAALERFEFLTSAAAYRAIEVFRRVIGHEPSTLPLTLWPSVFRPNCH